MTLHTCEIKLEFGAHSWQTPQTNLFSEMESRRHFSPVWGSYNKMVIIWDVSESQELVKQQFAAQTIAQQRCAR